MDRTRLESLSFDARRELALRTINSNVQRMLYESFEDSWPWLAANSMLDQFTLVDLVADAISHEWRGDPGYEPTCRALRRTHADAVQEFESTLPGNLVYWVDDPGPEVF